MRNWHHVPVACRCHRVYRCFYRRQRAIYVRYGVAGGHRHRVSADASGSGKSNEGAPLADRHDCSLPCAWARAASALADDNRAVRSLECLESGAIRVAAGSVHALIASAAAGVTPICTRTGP